MPQPDIHRFYGDMHQAVACRFCGLLEFCELRICTRSLKLDRFFALVLRKLMVFAGRVLSSTGPGFREPSAAPAAAIRIAVAAAGTSLRRVDSRESMNFSFCGFAIP